MLSSDQILGHLSRIQEVGLNSDQISIGYSPMLCTTIIPTYLAERSPIQMKGFVAGLVFTFGSMQSTFQNHEHSYIGEGSR